MQHHCQSTLHLGPKVESRFEESSMGVFEDMNRFLEERLEEFLKSHPNLELQVLDDQLREQETALKNSLLQMKTEQQQTQQNILKTAQEVQRWHERIAKAEQAQRPDLAEAARDREAAFLRQGNQQWAQMELIRQNIQQTQTLSTQISSRRQDLQVKIRETQATPKASSTPQSWQSTTTEQPWTSQYTPSEPDSLEAKFKRWEMEEELEALRRKIGH
jgi:uncharacterized protein (TIGR04376 family)